MSDEPDLVGRARGRHLVVIGGGIAGLVAAYESAKVGLRVTLLEASPTLGGAVAGAELDGTVVDTGADRWLPGRGSTPGAVDALVDDLGLSAEVVDAADTGPRRIETATGVAALPDDSIFGIPANPFAPAVRRLIGRRGVWRAYLDRLRPPFTIGHEHDLGDLVGRRMGRAVVERMIRPVTRAVHGVEPHDIDVTVAIRGLSTALSRTGSLSGAVAQLRGDAAHRQPRSLRGGLHTLIDALAARLQEYAVETHVGVRAGALRRRGDEWAIDTVVDGSPATMIADAVIIATEPAATRMLLSHVLDAPPAAPVADGVDLDVVTMRVRATSTGPAEVVSRDGDVSIVDVDALWGHGAPATGQTTSATASNTSATGSTEPSTPDAASRAPGAALRTLRVAMHAADEEPVARAAAAITRLWHPDVRVEHAVARHWRLAPPSWRLGFTAAADETRDAVAALPGLGVVGAAISGSGLTRIVPDAVREADRVRSGVLWQR